MQKCYAKVSGTQTILKQFRGFLWKNISGKAFSFIQDGGRMTSAMNL
jgi:hypothetical protein